MSTTIHHAGWPISNGSYARGCRCDGCKAKKRAYYEQNKDEIAAKQRASKHWSKMAQRIEQFVARGISTTEIMDTLGVGYAEVKDVRDRMAS